MAERLGRPFFIPLAALLAGFVFSIDIAAEYDFGISLLYLAVLALVSAAATGRAVARTALACMVLAVVAWTVVNLRGTSPQSALRCLFACIAISVTAALLIGRKRLEETKQALERSRSEVEHFANSVPYVLWHSNPRGEIVYLNESWTSVTGLDRWSVLEAQRYNDVVHPDDKGVLLETLAAAVAHRTKADLKARIRHADGSYRWMQIYDTPVFSPFTGCVERYGGLSDVHDEVVAKEQLQQLRNELERSKAELVNFTDSVPQILWRADTDGNIDFYNRRYTEITGRRFQETIELREYINDYHPDDRSEFLRLLRKAFSTRTELRANFRLRHADGSYRWMSLVGRPVRLSEGSEEIRYYGGITDIHDEVMAHQKVRELNETLEQRVAERTSELLRTERRYAGLFDVSNMTFAEMDFSAAEKALEELKARGVSDLRGYMAAHPDELARTLRLIRTTRVNEALARLMGYDSAADLVLHLPQHNAENDFDLLRRQLEMYFDGVHQIDGRSVITRKDGRRIRVYFTATRLTDGLHLCSHVDLSDEERIEALRRAAQAELARANRVATVGALSASIAHELNQPIASILMDAQTALRLIAQANHDIATFKRILLRVAKTAQRVVSIVQRTRDNIVAGRRAVKAIDICRLAIETRELLNHDLQRAGVELAIVCSDAVPLINGDPVELQQVFVNLVNNAVDAMRDQSGVRRITLEIIATAGTVRVRVTDTGPGIPAEYLERLFEPFFTTKPTGIGMGLQICRSAVEAMGGQLTVTNQTGAGASFSFDLPVHLEDSHRSALPGA